MTRFAPLLALGGLLLLPNAATCAETHVQVNADLGGFYLVPDKGWKGSAVLLLHGFADDADGVGELGKHLAEALAGRGIASLRINFRGEGDRLRTEILSTFGTRLADAAAGRDFLLHARGVDAFRIGVQGFGLGASTAIETAARHPQWFRSMALWASPSGDHFALWKDDERAQRALRDGIASVEEPGWKRITTRREFYDSFRGIDLDRSLALYPGAFLSVRGTEDTLPQHEAEFLRLVKGRPAEAVLVGGADHRFKVLETGGKRSERVVALTADWFARTLAQP